VVAGAWTDTGWPATMESAVRSGLAAMRELESRQTSPSAQKPAIESAREASGASQQAPA
jgi:hypothetical protein